MKNVVKKIGISILLLLMVLTVLSQNFDSTRIFKVMAKARRGEPITIVVLGGSITQGSAASEEDKRWANIMVNWWKTTFPKSSITFVNSGIGATGSDYGVHRLQRDVFSKNPDFVVVEFSVNDNSSVFTTETMEGIVRQILKNDKTPGMMMLLLKKQDGTSSMDLHKAVANYYGIPVVNYAEKIDSCLKKDSVSINNLYVDGLHPNDKGMSYIARFVTEKLTSIYNKLPLDSAIRIPETKLIKPLINTKFDNTSLYMSSDIVAKGEKGWIVTNSGWISSKINSEISFEFIGNTVSIMYSSHNSSDRGRADIWVDNQKPKTLNSSWTKNWGPSISFAMIDSSLSDGKHILHIRNIGKAESPSKSAYFEITNILTSSKSESAIPIAKIQPIKSILLQNSKTEILLDGSQSLDPHGRKLIYRKWFMLSKPATSKALIANDTAVVSKMMPDVAGNYCIGLVVSNGIDSSLLARVRCNVRLANLPPKAVIGEDSVVATNSLVSLDGSLSFDPENDPLSYRWTIVSQPTGSSVSLMNQETAFAKIKPVVDGEYIISLAVADQLNAVSPVKTIKLVATSGNIGDIVLKPLLSISPNPAKDICKISYAITKKEKVVLTLGDASNTKTFKIVDAIQNVGRYEINSDIKALSKGSYNITLTTPEIIITKKLYVK